uniref:Uncharacterized protein n=4 Tax=Aegilops tauschii subsp. strangulata TaxID=200361 RepID=A0A453JJ06_AEGTS
GFHLIFSHSSSLPQRSARSSSPPRLSWRPRSSAGRSSSAAPYPILPRALSSSGLLSATTQNTAATTGVDLSCDESRRRLVNSLVYRSKQRGFLELDLVLGI